MTDASIGVPKAESESSATDIDDTPPVSTTVWVPDGSGEWTPTHLPEGETMEITLQDGRKVALVQAHEEIEDTQPGAGDDFEENE